MPARKWENQDEIQKEKILKVLRKTKQPFMSTQTIAKKTDLHRHTTTKYLKFLVKRGKVTVVRVGRADIYQIKRK